METRKDFARVGMRCWAVDDPLPPGLEDGTEVKVIRTGTQPQAVIVQDLQGAQWNLFQWQLDCGWMFQLEGEEWLPESDAQVQQVLQQLLDEARAHGNDSPPFGSEHRISVGGLEWLVRRNGNPVEAG